MRHVIRFYALLLAGLFAHSAAKAQVVLDSSPYVQNFDGLASGLPAGWTVRLSSTASALGNEGALITAATEWKSTAGNFRNVASGSGLDSLASTSAQAISTNRALAVRQTGSTTTFISDPGAGLVLAIANTTGKQNFSLTFKTQILDNQTRTTVWTVQYATTSAGTEWFTLGTFTGTKWGSTEHTFSFGSALNNISNTVYIRVVALTASTGSGSRDTFAIDDFSLSWESGSAVTTAPTTQTSAFTFSGTLGTVTGVNFTSGNGAQRLVVARKGTAPTFVPVDNTTYAASGVFGTSTALGDGSFAVYRGPAATFRLSGLEPNTTYHFTAFEFNGGEGDQKYLTTSAPVASVTTGAAVFALDFDNSSFGDWTPVSAASNRNWTIITGTGADASAAFAEGNGFGGDAASDDWLISPAMDASVVTNPSLKYALQSAFTDNIPGFSVWVQAVASADAPLSTNPADWTEQTSTLPTADNEWQNKTIELSGIPSTGFFRVAFRYQSSGTGSAAAKRFRVDSISLENGVPLVRPTVGTGSFAVLDVSASSGQVSFIKGNGARRIVIMKEGGVPDALPADGTSYNASEIFGQGTQLGTGNFVVANGDIAGFSVFSLKPETTYNFTVFEYNGVGTSTLYYTDVSFNGTSITTKANTGGGGSVAVDLFFSEYLEGYSNNKVLEIFNGTGREIDLSGYRVTGKNNGTDVITTLTWPAGTILANNAIRVIVDGAASDTLKALANDVLPVIPQNSSVRYATSFNGNDYRALERNTGGQWAMIDIIGDIAVPAPSVAWDVAGIPAATVNRTLVRKSFVNKGNLNWTMSAGTSVDNSEWEVLSFNNSTNIGQHTFNPDALVDPFDFTVTPAGLTSVQLNWRLNGAGHGILLVQSADNQFVAPVNGTAYSVGQFLGNDEVIAAGASTSINLSGLVAGTTYFFKIYSVNDLNNYSPGKVASSSTAKGEPTAHATAFALNSFTGSSLAFSWVDATGAVSPDGYLLVISKNGAASISNPVDGVDPVESVLMKKIMPGVQSAAFTGLENNVTYSAKLFAFTNRGALINFKTDGNIPTAQGTTSGTSLQETIGGTLKGADLVTLLRNDYRVTRSLGYDNARERMYISIDLTTLDSLTCVYTGYSTKVNRAGGGRTQAAAAGINAEHTWPQSKGAENEPMRSDLHHLFPTWENVNSARGNLPFAEIPDNQTSTWWGRRTTGGLTTPPALAIRDFYSELRSGTNFEPREDHKGNVARAIFYFWMRWQNDALVASNQSFFEGMKETLYRWHYQDLPDEREVKRSNEIATEQGNRNPFVHDTTLIRRAFFPHIGDAPANAYVINTPVLSFGVRKVGARDTLFVYVQNLSASTALSLSNIRTEGTGAAAFTPLVSILNVPAGRTGAIPVVFTAPSAAQFASTLLFNASFAPANASVTMSGAGGRAAFDLRPNELRYFVDQPMDDIRTFVLHNTGETIARVNEIKATETVFNNSTLFLGDLDLPFEILPGDSVVAELQVDISKLTESSSDTIFVKVDGEVLSEYILVRGLLSTSTEPERGISTYQLHQNYPNPFNPSTNISFDLPSSSKVRLEVFSITGQKVGEAANGTFAAGRHTVAFNASKLSSGLYIYRITTDSFSASRKFMLLK